MKLNQKVVYLGIGQSDQMARLFVQHLFGDLGVFTAMPISIIFCLKFANY